MCQVTGREAGGEGDKSTWKAQLVKFLSSSTCAQNTSVGPWYLYIYTHITGDPFMWVLTHIKDSIVLAFLEIHDYSDASIENHGHRPTYATSAGWQTWKSTQPWPEDAGQLTTNKQKCWFFPDLDHLSVVFLLVIRPLLNLNWSLMYVSRFLLFVTKSICLCFGRFWLTWKIGLFCM